MYPATGDVDISYVESGMDKGGRKSENKLLMAMFLCM